MWRLQQPVAALATLDIAFLGDDTRSVRKMVESIAALAVAHSDEVARHGEAYRRLETSVRAIEVIAHALQTRSAVLSDRIRHEYRRAEQGVGTLVSRLARERDLLDVPPDRRNRRNLSRRPSRETERAVTHKLEVMLRERLARWVASAALPAYALPPNSILGPWSGQLSNSGDSIRLESISGTTIDAVSYSSSPPWPVSAHALGAESDWTGLDESLLQYRGRSLERISFSSPASDPANWIASPLPSGPSPGRPNSISLPSPILIATTVSAVQHSTNSILTH